MKNTLIIGLVLICGNVLAAPTIGGPTISAGPGGAIGGSSGGVGVSNTVTTATTVLVTYTNNPSFWSLVSFPVAASGGQVNMTVNNADATTYNIYRQTFPAALTTNYFDIVVPPGGYYSAALAGGGGISGTVGNQVISYLSTNSLGVSGLTAAQLADGTLTFNGAGMISNSATATTATSVSNNMAALSILGPENPMINVITNSLASSASNNFIVIGSGAELAAINTEFYLYFYEELTPFYYYTNQAGYGLTWDPTGSSQTFTVEITNSAGHLVYLSGDGDFPASSIWFTNDLVYLTPSSFITTYQVDDTYLPQFSGGFYAQGTASYSNATDFIVHPWVERPLMTNATRLILDTGLIDGFENRFGDLELLFKYVANGEVELLALGNCNTNLQGARALAAVANFYGVPTVPVGIATDSPGFNCGFASNVANVFPNPLYTDYGVWGAKRLYRKILAEQPTNTVTLVFLGTMRNFYELYNSTSGDGYSALSGSNLLLRARQVVFSNGDYDNACAAHLLEYNLTSDPTAAESINSISNMPLRVTWCGGNVFNEVKAGTNLALNIELTPARFAASNSLAASSSSYAYSWSALALTAAIRPQQTYGTWFTNITGHGYWISGSLRNEWRYDGTYQEFLRPPGITNCTSYILASQFITRQLSQFYRTVPEKFMQRLNRTGDTMTGLLGLGSGTIIYSNSVSSWPTNAPYAGASFVGSSNGYGIYLLTSSGGTTWTATNRLGP